MVVINEFWRNFKFHMIAFLLIIASWPLSVLFNFSVSPFYVEFIPSIYRGRDLIVDSAGVVFYKFSGAIYFYSLFVCFVFFVLNLISIVRCKIRFRSIKFQGKEFFVSIFILVIILIHNILFYFGPSTISRAGRYSGALYRGDFYFGICLPSFAMPVSLFAFFAILVMQFLVLSRKD